MVRSAHQMVSLLQARDQGRADNQNSSGSRKRTRPSSNEQRPKQHVTSLRDLVLIGAAFRPNQITLDVIQQSRHTLPPTTPARLPSTQATISCTPDPTLPDQWLHSMATHQLDTRINSHSEDR